MKKKAFAKANLMLRVLQKRSDGYHDLQMINTKISLYDQIEVKKNHLSQDEIIYVLKKEKEENKEHLIFKVLQAFKKAYQINQNYTIWIKKNIPMGAGLGGVSMDVATILECLTKKLKLGLSKKTLCDFTLAFGADIPYGFYDCPCIVEGIGEKITPISLTKKRLILIHPKLFVSTAFIFEHCSQDGIKFTHEKLVNEIEKSRYENQLQAITLCLYPVLQELVTKCEIYGQIFMTGSGSCFLLDTNQNKKKIARTIKKNFPSYEVKIIQTKKGKKE